MGGTSDTQFDGTSTLWVLQRIFATLGLPVELVIDYETSFITNEFREFLKSNGIKHTYIPTYHKSSIGQAGLMLCTNCPKKLDKSDITLSFSRFF